MCHEIRDLYVDWLPCLARQWGLMQLVNANQLAARYNVSRRTVIAWAAAGKIPRLALSARCTKYDL